MHLERCMERDASSWYFNRYVKIFPLSLSLFYQIPRFSKGNFRAEKGGRMIQHRARQPQLYSRFQMAESLTARAKSAP